MPWSAAASALGGLAGGIVSAISQSSANAKNIQMQEKINAMQLEYAKHANQYAVADRQAAGLSPLDTQPMSVPQLDAAQVKPVSDGQFINNAVSNAVSAYRENKIADSVVSANDAKASSDNAQALLMSQELSEKILSMQDRIDMYTQQLQNEKDKHSEFALNLQNRIDKTLEEIENLRKSNADLQSIINERNHNLNIYKSLGLPTDVNISPGPLWSTGTAVGLTESKLNSEKSLSSSISDVDKRNAYQEYLRQRKAQEELEIKQPVRAGKISVKESNRLLKEFKADTLTYEEFSKRYDALY